jgi:hypothetical protein
MNRVAGFEPKSSDLLSFCKKIISEARGEDCRSACKRVDSQNEGLWNLASSMESSERARKARSTRAPYPLSLRERREPANAGKVG